MNSAFLMDCYHIAAGINEIIDMVLRIDYHQMGIEKQVAVRPYVLDEFRTESYLRYEDSVHHVKMKILGSGLFRIPERVQH